MSHDLSRPVGTSQGHAAELRRARSALQQVTGLPAVLFRIDGVAYAGAFEVDDVEHERRRQISMGAVTSAALLHALWLIPMGMSVTASALPDVKAARLRAAPHVASETEHGFVRTYTPPGHLRAIAVAGLDFGKCLRRAIQFTPVVLRYVVLSAVGRHQPPSRLLHEAREWEVGILRSEGDQVETIVPASAQLGVPSVWRWWAAELAYDAFVRSP